MALSYQSSGGNFLQRSGSYDNAGLVGEPITFCGEAHYWYFMLLLCVSGGCRAQLAIYPTYLPPETVLGLCRTYIDYGWA
eukprot:3462200-Ditylum_brightwellii.AAC.1